MAVIFGKVCVVSYTVNEDPVVLYLTMYANGSKSDVQESSQSNSEKAFLVP